MRRQSRQGWTMLLALAAVAVLALALVWAAAPEDLRGLYLLVGAIVTGLVYGVLYAIQVRRHW